MSSQAILDTCPFCCDRQTSPGYYDCGSVEKAGWYRHENCLARQIANLTATIAERDAFIGRLWDAIHSGGRRGIPAYLIASDEYKKLRAEYTTIMLTATPPVAASRS